MQNPQTTVSFEGTRVLINGQPTYGDCEQVEGLLFNLRTVNATFDDRKPKASVTEGNTLGKVSWWDDDGSHPENDYAGYGQWHSPESAFANTQRFIKNLA